MEFKLKEERTFDTEELIFESKRLVALGRLYHSLVINLGFLYMLRRTI